MSLFDVAVDFFDFFFNGVPGKRSCGLYVCVSEYMRESEGELELQIIMLPSYSQPARRKHLQPRAPTRWVLLSPLSVDTS